MKPVVIVPASDDIARLAGERLATYLERVMGSPPALHNDSEPLPTSGDLFLIGDSPRNRSTAAMGFEAKWANERPDGYVLRTLDTSGRHAVVAAGRGSAGDKAAVQQLIADTPVRGDSIEIKKWDIRRSPFIQTREVIMGDACPWDPFGYEEAVPVEDRARTYDVVWESEALRLNCPDPTRPATGLKRIVQKYCIENWPVATLVDYVDQMDAFGFNSIQFYEDYESYIHSGSLVTRREYRDKLLAMMRRTRELNNRATLLTWGGHAFLHNGKRVVRDWDDPLMDEPLHWEEKVSAESRCWNDPVERRQIEDHTTYQAQYAPFVDHVITHFFDPGGCSRNGCTMGTCMAMMNRQVEVFRQENPSLEATFNVWPLTSDAPGYRMEEVDAPSTWTQTFTWWHFSHAVDRLAPDIMVANRAYEPRVADACRRWGRRYGLWPWYTSDQEITASLHVAAERLGRELGSLPPEAGDDLEYIALPNNCHGLSAASLYVAAQLLWEPKQDPFVLLRSFCEHVFGPRVAAAAYAGYEAVARIRNRDIRGDTVFSDAYLGAGTPNPEEDAVLSGEALRRLRATRADRQWIPKVPMVIDPDTMLDDLRDHVRMIHDYARFRTAFVRCVPKVRITPADWKKLPHVRTLDVSGGMIEWRKAEALRRYRDR